MVNLGTKMIIDRMNDVCTKYIVISFVTLIYFNGLGNILLLHRIIPILPHLCNTLILESTTTITYFLKNYIKLNSAHCSHYQQHFSQVLWNNIIMPEIMFVFKITTCSKIIHYHKIERTVCIKNWIHFELVYIIIITK